MDQLDSYKMCAQNDQQHIAEISSSHECISIIRYTLQRHGCLIMHKAPVLGAEYELV